MSEARRLAELSVAVRESTLKRLARVPEGFEDWRPADGALSIAELVRHLADADRWLVHKLEDPEHSSEPVVPARLESCDRVAFEELVRDLERCGHRRHAALASLPESLLDQSVPDQRFGGEATVWWVVVRGNLDHEAHHRGQLATYLRLIGSSGGE